MDLTHADVDKILKIVDRAGERDIRLEFGDLKIHVGCARETPRGDAPPPAAPDPDTRGDGPPR